MARILATGAHFTIEAWPDEGVIGAPMFDSERNMVGIVTGTEERPDKSGQFVMAVRIFDTQPGRLLIRDMMADRNANTTVEGRRDD